MLQTFRTCGTFSARNPMKIFYYGFILPLSRLPFFVLYGISNVFYFIFYYLSGYRKKVVMQNIRNSFPEKTHKEHVLICKQFYRHLCDITLESLKIFSIREHEVYERMICKNPEVVNRYFDQGRSIILAGGHFNNWELFAVAIDHAVKHQTIAIYKPMTNLFFDQKMRETRSKYGLRMISTKIVRQVMEQERGSMTMTIFGIDQSPPLTSNSYWMRFLNQDTGVLFGAERYAKEFNYPVVFCRINKESRGHYSFEFVDVVEFPLESAFGEITEKVTHLIEQDIIKNPQYWLWSHKRWKHKRPQGHVNSPTN